MHMEQDQLLSLGFCGIWRETAKIIAKERNIFLQIGLTIILPLAFIYLAHIELSFLLLQNISSLEYTLENDVFAPYEKTSMALSRAWQEFALIQVAYLFFLFAFSLLSASAIFYVVACIFSDKRVTFKEVIRVVPKLWKKVMVTSLCIVVILFVYTFVFYLLAIVIVIPLPFNPNDIERYLLLGAPLLLLHLFGLRYTSPFCELANVVSVLEESCGLQALRRSKVLTEGKMGIPRPVYLVVPLGMIGTVYLYLSFIVFDQSNVGVFKRVGFGIICLFLLSNFILLGLVLQPVIYMVCKSCHHEPIDKSVLAHHLEGYYGESYVLIKSKGIKLKEQI